MKYAIRVLHIVNRLEKNNSISSIVMNYYQNIDKEKVVFDIISHGDANEDLVREVVESGGKVYIFPELKLSKLQKCRSQFKKLLQGSLRYSIVHCHSQHAAIAYLGIAEEMGIKTRILHSHIPNLPDEVRQRIRYRILNRLAKRHANQYIACSKMAADTLFGDTSERVFFLKNAVRLNQFYFSKEERESTRRKLNMEDKIVLGNLGKITEKNNQEFLLKIMAKLVKLNPNFHLLLIGEGEKERELREKIYQMGLQDYITLVGARADSEIYFNAMDAFLLPSQYESVPLNGVEAQAMGLPCFLAQGITTEVNISGQVYFLKLEEEIWVKKIMTWQENSKNITRKVNMKDITEKGYNILVEANRLTRYYQDKHDNSMVSREVLMLK